MTDFNKTTPVKPHLDVPPSLAGRVEYLGGTVKASNPPGGEVDRGRYVTLPPVRRTA